MITAAQKKGLLAVLLADEEDETTRIELEQHQRRAPSNAARSLFAHEVSTEVRFADLEDDYEAAVTEATELLDALHEDIKTGIQLSLFGEDRAPRTPAEAQAVMHELTTNQPEEIQQQESNTAWVIAGILAATYLLGGRRVTEEADRQGVDVAGVSPVELAAEEFYDQGLAVAQHPWRRITQKMDETLSSQATLLQDEVTVDDVAGEMEQIKIDGSVDQARQAVQTTGGRGRVDTVESNPELEPAQIWASAIMDGVACNRCELDDGREFSDMEEARMFFPDGYNRRCAGGSRCRCTLVLAFT